MMLDEYSAIRRQAYLHGVDPNLMLAIRIAENGFADKPVGAYMGVLPQVMDREEARREAAASIRNHMLMMLRSLQGAAYEIIDGEPYKDGQRYRTLALTKAAITTIRDRWAPLGAANDPNDKNANWVRNVMIWYRRLIQDGTSAWENPTN